MSKKDLSLAEKIEALEKLFSQKYIAKKVGVSERYLRYIKEGKRSGSGIKRKITYFYNHSLDRLRQVYKEIRKAKTEGKKKRWKKYIKKDIQFSLDNKLIKVDEEKAKYIRSKKKKIYSGMAVITYGLQVGFFKAVKNTITITSIFFNSVEDAQEDIQKQVDDWINEKQSIYIISIKYKIIIREV